MTKPFHQTQLNRCLLVVALLAQSLLLSGASLPCAEGATAHPTPAEAQPTVDTLPLPIQYAFSGDVGRDDPTYHLTPHAGGGYAAANPRTGLAGEELRRHPQPRQPARVLLLLPLQCRARRPGRRIQVLRKEGLVQTVHLERSEKTEGRRQLVRRPTNEGCRCDLVCLTLPRPRPAPGAVQQTQVSRDLELPAERPGQPDPMDHAHDYIVVGAGSAGSVLANRLTADGRTYCCSRPARRAIR